jgi:hypothetical protein
MMLLGFICGIPLAMLAFKIGESDGNVVYQIIEDAAKRNAKN